MLPAILPMHLSALSILEYRVSRLSSARALAASSGKMKCVTFSRQRSGYLGARYPWESALTGAEVCPAVAQDVRDQEVNEPSAIPCLPFSGPYQRGHITGSEAGLGVRCGQKLVDVREGRTHCLPGGKEDSG